MCIIVPRGTGNNTQTTSTNGWYLLVGSSIAVLNLVVDLQQVNQVQKYY
jgi:hypothetical protein